MDFICEKCGIQARLGTIAYKNQKKKYQHVFCRECSKARYASMLSIKMRNQYSNVIKNTDIVKVQCLRCGGEFSKQYRVAKKGYKCQSCVTKDNRARYKESYDIASRRRINNKEFSNAVSNGMNTKCSKELLSYNGKINALALWNDDERKRKELEHRQTEEYRINRSGRKTNLLDNNEYIERASVIHNNKYDYSLVEYEHSKKKIIIICPQHGQFKQYAADHLYHNNGCPECAKSITISKPHQRIINYVKQLDNDVLINDRNILDGLEIDVYSQTFNIGIEIHGIFWHSFNELETKDQINRHKTKADIAYSRNIKLYQIFETELLYKSDIILSMLSHAFKMSKKIHARSCKIKEISNHQAISFFENNHLQGGRNASVNIALEYEDEIVSCIALSRHKIYEYELIRSASALNVCVVGGLSKLLNAARKICHMHSLMTYADRRYSEANSYVQVGFERLCNTKPGYYYVKGNNIYSRQKFQKHKLPRLLPDYDDALSEPMNMFHNGYRRLWDAGHVKLIKTF